jgi:hypothetical protein
MVFGDMGLDSDWKSRRITSPNRETNLKIMVDCSLKKGQIYGML